MAAYAAPDLAVVLAMLTPAQFERLDKKFADTGVEFTKKYLKGNEAEQRKRRDKRTLELMREWFGDLSDEQENQIMLASARLPLLYVQRLQNRQRRQSEFVALLKAYRSPEELEPRLRSWLTEWEEGATPEYRRVSELHREQYMQMLLELDRSLKPVQRAHAVTRLNDYAEVFTALAAQGKPSRPGS
jgi:polyphosphate kinase 2 (PPK2 family)